MPLPRPALPAPRSRDGFTLVELLVVLAILGMSAVVVSTVRPARSGMDSLDDVVTRARRLAVQRAQRMTLRLEGDGQWLISVATTAVTEPSDSVAFGRLAGATLTPLRLTIDPMGSCQPIGGNRGAPFDPLRCRWLSADSTR